MNPKSDYFIYTFSVVYLTQGVPKDDNDPANDQTTLRAVVCTVTEGQLTPAKMGTLVSEHLLPWLSPKIKRVASVRGPEWQIKPIMVDGACHTVDPEALDMEDVDKSIGSFELESVEMLEGHDDSKPEEVTHLADAKYGTDPYSFGADTPENDYRN